MIVTGIRISAVQVVATATLAALIAGGGLGRFIVDGFQQGDRTMTTAGAVLVAVLALATEGAFALTGRLSTPKTGEPAEKRARNLQEHLQVHRFAGAVRLVVPPRYGSGLDP